MFIARYSQVVIIQNKLTTARARRKKKCSHAWLLLTSYHQKLSFKPNCGPKSNKRNKRRSSENCAYEGKSFKRKSFIFSHRNFISGILH